MPIAPSFYDNWRDILAELEAQSDRGVAIVGAALLDAKLEEALRLSFVPGLPESELKELVDGPAAPLNSFAGKARLAHALGLVGDKSYADLQKIRKVRNRFAHELKVKAFDDALVTSLCDGLLLAELRFEGEPEPGGPRGRFIRSTANLAHLIYSELVAGTPLGTKASKSP